MRVWQPRDWLVYARARVYLTCASLYCTFRPISPVGIARCSGFMAGSVFESRGGITFYRQACASGIVFTQWSKNGVFAPQGDTLPHKLRSARPCQISRLSGRKCGNTAPKTVKISNFGHKFVLQGDSFAIFLRNSQHLYASIDSF